MFCKTCNIKMNEVFRCDNGKFYKFRRCPRCYFESRVIPYVFDDAESSGKKGKGKAKEDNGKKYNKSKNRRRGGQKSTKRT